MRRLSFVSKFIRPWTRPIGTLRKYPIPRPSLEKIRNVAIIAHVDHGKTTLVDQLIRQSGMNLRVSERMLDCNELEAERGITILSKCTRVYYRDYVLNIVDTPGHADFGGEVERILSMVDGIVLVVDAVEGPRTQTKFVLQKALISTKIVPIVIVNKVDRPCNRELGEVDNEIFDLFVSLNANDQQLDYVTVYGSGKLGFCRKTWQEALETAKDYEKSDLKVTGSKNKSQKELLPESTTNELADLFDTIVEKVSHPEIQKHPEEEKDEKGQGFAMLVTQMEIISGLGPTVTGKIHSGWVQKGDHIFAISPSSEICGKGKVKEVSFVHGVKRTPVKAGFCGDIVSISCEGFFPVPAQTLSSISTTKPLTSRDIDPPTLEVSLTVNDSPFSGRDGKKITQHALTERLRHEAISNISISVQESPQKDKMLVCGRGELQLGILFETMRREGYEFSLSPPSVVFKEKDGVKLEPWERLFIIVPQEKHADVVDRLLQRRGELQQMQQSDNSENMEIEVDIASQDFIGMQTQLRDSTGGQCTISSELLDYRVARPSIKKPRKGVIISATTGMIHMVDLSKAQRSGVTFVSPNRDIYEGAIVGETNNDIDMEYNLTKSWKDNYAKADHLNPPIQMSLEKMLGYIQEDEKVEVTPKRILMRKCILNTDERKLAQRKKAKL